MIPKKGDVCSEEEDVLRAILFDKYDPLNKTLTPSFFKGKDISVSRLKVLSKKKIIEIFQKEVAKPSKPLFGTAQINVGVLCRICSEYQPSPCHLVVMADPTNTNMAHALIQPQEKISHGLSKEIVANLEIDLLIQKRSFVEIVRCFWIGVLRQIKAWTSR